MSDFNLHHPLWSNKPRHACNRVSAAKPLVEIVENFHLQLLTVPGTETHRWASGKSTIDLTVAMEEITWVVWCKVDTDLDHDSTTSQ